MMSRSGLAVLPLGSFAVPRNLNTKNHGRKIGYIHARKKKQYTIKNNKIK
jgi:hypothetical protein